MHRPFYEQKEKLVQKSVLVTLKRDIDKIKRKISNAKSVVKNIFCRSCKKKCFLMLVNNLLTLYKKYKIIYNIYNPPKNYATIRNMCLLQMIIIVLRDFEYYSEDTINSLIDLMLITAYSSNIKQIMETIAGQYAIEDLCVPWIRSSIATEFHNNKNNNEINRNSLIKVEKTPWEKEVVRRVSICIKKMQRLYFQVQIENEVLSFNEYIKSVAIIVKNLNLDKIKIFIEESNNEYNNLQERTYNRYKKINCLIPGDNIYGRFDYLSLTNYLVYIEKNNSIYIDEIAARRHISSSHKSFLFIILTSIFTYSNRIYGNIPDYLKKIALVNRILEYERKINLLMEELLIKIMNKIYKINQEDKIESILNLNIDLEKKYLNIFMIK